MTIIVDYSRNELLSDQAHTLLVDYYCREGEDPQDAYARAAVAFCKSDYDLAQRIYDYASKGSVLKVVEWAVIGLTSAALVMLLLHRFLS